MQATGNAPEVRRAAAVALAGRFFVARMPGPADRDVARQLGTEAAPMVSKTLDLAQQALALGRHYLRQGRDLEALDILGKLVRLGQLEPAVAEQTQIHLAEIHLRRRDFAQARRHINVALAYQPAKAEYHHMMAMAVEDDPEADPRRAMQHYR